MLRRRFRRTEDRVEPTDRVVRDDVAYDDAPRRSVGREDAVYEETPVTTRSERYVDEPVTTDRAVVEEHGTTYFGSPAARINSVLFALFAALEGLLALRFAFVAFGANRSSGFVNFIMDFSWPFVRPFTNAFNDRTWDQGIIEYSTLLAMGVYALAFILVGMLVAATMPDVDGHSRFDRRRMTHS